MGRSALRSPVALSVGLAALVCVGWSLPARADSAQARVHFDKGRAYFQVDEYRKAIEEFKAAHVEKPDPAFLYNIAECYRHLDETQEALTYYRRFLKLTPANDRARPAVEKRIAELQKAARQAKPPNGEPHVEAHAEAPPPPSVAPPPAPVAPPVAVLVSARAAPAPAATPVWRRGWFLATAAAIVVGGLAIGLWAASRAPGPPDTPLGNQHAF
jgi:tetratricopeptide (TPR) repeat protein